MTLYIICITIFLSHSGLWDINNLPTTLKWSFIVAFAMLLKFQKANNPDYFANSMRDNLKILVIVEFIVNLYVFNFLVEVVAFPFMVMLSLSLVRRICG